MSLPLWGELASSLLVPEGTLVTFPEEEVSRRMQSSPGGIVGLGGM